MNKETSIALKDLALISDRRSCALIDKQGNIVWYCPERFDKPALLAQLLDVEKGGIWQLEANGLTFDKRGYLQDSALLSTHFKSKDGNLTIEDWMPLDGRFFGICRSLSASPVPLRMILRPRPDFGNRPPLFSHQSKNRVDIDMGLHLYSSHPLTISQQDILCEIPAGEAAWFVLSEKSFRCQATSVAESRTQTLKNWEAVSSHITYKGAYEKEVRNSLRVLRMLTYQQNGGIIAAATTSLPEVTGGQRNYDYRYVWLRDTAMIVSALTRAGSDGEEERKFLSFICSAMHRIKEPVVPFFTLDQQPAPHEQELALQGYKGSTPVRIGNNANNQLQLDANSNVLIAAKVIYSTFDTREHWEIIQRLANHLVANWQKTDHGIWEETPEKQYTSSKVIAAVSLEYIAEFSEDKEEKELWKTTAQTIRKWVHTHCLTADGAYAVYAGAETTDISAILFPIWGYTDADAPEMLKTLAILERDYRQNKLFRRHLVEFDSQKEGAFLAGTLWMAQYWVMRRDWDKVDTILEACLAFMNDVGLMPEEGDPVSGEWLGNLPQAFVHASLIGTVIDYQNARYEP